MRLSVVFEGVSGILSGSIQTVSTATRVCDMGFAVLGALKAKEGKDFTVKPMS